MLNSDRKARTAARKQQLSDQEFAASHITVPNFFVVLGVWQPKKDSVDSLSEKMSQLKASDIAVKPLKWVKIKPDPQHFPRPAPKLNLPHQKPAQAKSAPVKTGPTTFLTLPAELRQLDIYYSKTMPVKYYIRHTDYTKQWTTTLKKVDKRIVDDVDCVKVHVDQRP